MLNNLKKEVMTNKSPKLKSKFNVADFIMEGNEKE